MHLKSKSEATYTRECFVSK